MFVFLDAEFILQGLQGLWNLWNRLWNRPGRLQGLQGLWNRPGSEYPPKTYP